MLVFPSLFEGFGLPLLEAMHLGAPVACSNIGSLPEVGGQAVRFFDPRSQEQIAEAILSLAGDRGVRQQLIEAGRQQVACFSYERTAADTLGVFERVRDGRLPRPDVASFRPLAPHRVLDQGQGRWFFRLPNVRRIELRVLQADEPAQSERQVLEVSLDGTKLLDTPLDGRRTCTFVLPAATDNEFHTLEVTAAPRTLRSAKPCPVQVLNVIAFSTQQELRLVA